jgi:L-seryl-tRNA(Ser) seleniumtransferase
MNERLRAIPSIEQIRQRPGVAALEARFGRDAVVAALRAEADALRVRLTAPDEAGAVGDDAAHAIEAAAERRLARTIAPSLRRVINATGVVLHTNLGRAPLAEAAVDRIRALAGGYTNLEFDLAAGARGRRDVHAERLLCDLTSAEAAIVVNNNAAATLSILAALAAGREAVVSRGELVEIGGGFRVPDVMAQSGAILREVGTTNRTRAADYAAAVSEKTALILRVHPSNFSIAGFTERPSLEALVAIARQLHVRLVEDLGSGYVRSSGDEAAAPLRDEPDVAASVRAGADVVCFSGDKLLGGPQCGIIVGAADALGPIRRHPLMRALRVDKLTYAALEATLIEYATGRADRTIPVRRMAAATTSEIDVRARAIVTALLADGGAIACEVIDGASTIGGGSAPGLTLPTRLIALAAPGGADALETRLRAAEPPLIARIERDRVLLDLRTVLPEEDAIVLATLRRIARA